MGVGGGNSLREEMVKISATRPSPKDGYEDHIQRFRGPVPRTAMKSSRMFRETSGGTRL